MHIPYKHIGLAILFSSALAACGSNGDRVANTPSTPVIDGSLGADIAALNSQYVEIAAPDVAGATYSWTQVSGPSVTFIDTHSATAKLVTPANVSVGERATLKLVASAGGETMTDTIDIILSPCSAGADDIFVDCVAPGFGALRSYEQENDNPEGFKEGVYFTGSSERHLDWELVETGEPGHDTVIQLTFGANDPFNEVQTNSWFGIGAPDDLGPPSVPRVDLSAYENGAISFDYRYLSNSETIIEAGMECGYPCTSERKLAMATGEWQTMTIAMAAFKESGVDLTRLDVPFMFTTPWWNQNWGVFQIDNIRLSQTYTPLSITEPARPQGPLMLDLFDEGNQLVVDAGTIGLTLTHDALGYTIDYNASGGFTWFFSQFNFNNGYPDLTDYYHGELVINYTVNSWGNDTEGRVVLNAYCGQACELHPSYALPRTLEGVTTEVRIPVAELVARGLDLTRVIRIFEMKLRNSNPNGISITVHSAFLELSEQ